MTKNKITSHSYYVSYYYFTLRNNNYYVNEFNLKPFFTDNTTKKENNTEVNPFTPRPTTPSTKPTTTIRGPTIHEYLYFRERQLHCQAFNAQNIPPSAFPPDTIFKLTQNQIFTSILLAGACSTVSLEKKCVAAYFTLLVF